MPLPTSINDLSTTPASNYPAGSDAPSALDDSIRALSAILKESGAVLYSATGTDTITFSTSPAFTAYQSGQRFFFVASGANTGAVTLNINSLGAKAITKNGTAALVANDIISGSVVGVVYDGTQFQLVGSNTDQLAQDLQTSRRIVANAAGTADAITATFLPLVTALANGMTLYVRAASANATTTPTFTPNSGTIAAKTIVKGNGLALAAGDIAGAGHWIELQYDATLDKWVLLNPATGVSSGIPQASTAEILAETAVAKYISPDRLKASVRTVRAWVNFAGATGTINASFNVSSVTRNSTGNYTVNFTNPMADTNYFGAGIAGAGDTNTSSSAVREYNGGTKTTTAYQVATIGGASASLNYTDFTRAGIAIFGN